MRAFCPKGADEERDVADVPCQVDDLVAEAQSLGAVGGIGRRIEEQGVGQAERGHDPGVQSRVRPGANLLVEGRRPCDIGNTIARPGLEQVAGEEGEGLDEEPFVIVAPEQVYRLLGGDHASLRRLLRR